MSELKLSQRVQAIKPSPTIAVQQPGPESFGRRVATSSASARASRTSTPRPTSARRPIKAIEDGFTKYTAPDGTPELKQAIVDKLARENDLSYTLSQIVVSVGAKHSIFNLLMALIDPGDEVVVPAPYWVSYTDMSVLAGGVPVVVYAPLSQGFKITPAQLEDAITERTRLLIMNSPSNPTGAAYSRAELEGLGEVLRRHPQVVIASDDIYEHILWTEAPFCSLGNACPDLIDPAGSHQRRLEGLCHDRLAHRLRGGARLPGGSDAQDPVPEHVEPHLGLPGGGDGGPSPIPRTVSVRWSRPSRNVTTTSFGASTRSTGVAVPGRVTVPSTPFPISRR